MDLEKVKKQFDYYNLKFDHIYNNLDLIGILKTNQEALNLIQVVVDDEDRQHPIYNLESVIEGLNSLNIEPVDINNLNDVIDQLEEYKNKYVNFINLSSNIDKINKEETLRHKQKNVRFEKPTYGVFPADEEPNKHENNFNININEVDDIINQLKKYKQKNVRFEKPTIGVFPIYYYDSEGEIKYENTEINANRNLYKQIKTQLLYSTGITAATVFAEKFKKENLTSEAINFLKALTITKYPILIKAEAWKKAKRQLGAFSKWNFLPGIGGGTPWNTSRVEKIEAKNVDKIVHNDGGLTQRIFYSKTEAENNRSHYNKETANFESLQPPQADSILQQGKNKLQSKWFDKHFPASYTFNTDGSFLTGNGLNSELRSNIALYDSTENINNLYFPFYFQDLRTKEIAIFNATLTNLTLDISSTWESFGSFGKSEDSHIYRKMNSPTLNFGFRIIANRTYSEFKDEYDNDNIDIPELEMMYKKLNWLRGLTLPQYNDSENPDYAKMFYISQPIIKIKIGDLFEDPSGEPCIYGYLATYNWDPQWTEGIIETRAGYKLPRQAEIGVTVQVISGTMPDYKSTLFNSFKNKE